MSTFSGSTNTGIVLGSGTYTNPLTITSKGYVANTTGAVSGDAVFGPTGTAWAVSNYGTVNGTDPSQPSASGVHLLAGGFVANEALVTGNAQGVRIDGAAGTVSNLGTIAAVGATGNGVYLTAGGTVYNGGPAYPGSAITGYDGVRIGGGVGTLINYGSIVSTDTGFGAQGVDFLGGGTLTNYGSILGVGYHASGINAGSSADVIINGGAANGTAVIAGWLNGVDQFGGLGTIVNFARIIGGTDANSIGVYLQDGGTVVNSGTITGYHALKVTGVSGTVGNTGTIAAAAPLGKAVYLGLGGSVGNKALLTSAHDVIDIEGAAGTVDNFGTILATGIGAGVWINAGGTVNNTSIISGPGNGVFANNGYGTVFNSGTISDPGATGDGVCLEGGGYVTNGVTGYITGPDTGIEIQTTPGTVINNGTVTATGGAGISFLAGGTVMNTGSISGVSNGVIIAGSAGTVASLGTVNATGAFGASVYLAAGGTVSNGSAIETSALVFGNSNAVAIFNAPGSVTNYGTIAAIGTAGYGIVISNGGTVTNFETVTQSGTSGAAILLGSGGSVANSGTIVATDKSGIAGFAVYLNAGGTVTNSALIQGGKNGVVAGTGAGFVINSGTIVTVDTATGAAIAMHLGGYVSNASTGTLAGFNNAVFASGAAGTVVNSSTLLSTSTSAFAVDWTVGGNVTNNAKGLISAGADGILISGGPGTVSNAGSIIANGSIFGVGVAINNANGTITNSSTGVISGAKSGINLGGTALGYIDNYGTILASGSITNAGGSIVYGDAIHFNNGGGTITNRASGLIEGYHQGIFTGASSAATVVNFGTIKTGESIRNRTAIMTAIGSVTVRPISQFLEQ